MMLELSPGVILSLVTVLALFGTKLWSLGAKVEGAATRDELNTRDAWQPREFEASIKDKSKESMESHKVFAHKSGVVKIESQMFDIEKEMSLRFDAFRKEVNDRFDKADDYDRKMIDLLTKINFRVTPKGEQL